MKKSSNLKHSESGTAVWVKSFSCWWIRCGARHHLRRDEHGREDSHEAAQVLKGTRVAAEKVAAAGGDDEVGQHRFDASQEDIQLLLYCAWNRRHSLLHSFKASGWGRGVAADQHQTRLLKVRELYSK